MNINEKLDENAAIKLWNHLARDPYFKGLTDGMGVLQVHPIDSYQRHGFSANFKDWVEFLQVFAKRMEEIRTQ